MTAVGLGQKGSQALGKGSNPSLYLHCSTSTTFLRRKIVIPKIVIPPLLCMKKIDTRVFLKPGRVPLQNFLVLRQKNFDKKS